MPINLKPNKSRLSTLLIVPGHIEVYYKVQNQGAQGNYICHKMISKIATKYIKISEAWRSMKDMKFRFEFFFKYPSTK